MRRHHLFVIVAIALVTAIACSGGASEPKLIGRGLLGGTNTDKLSVPLEDVHVDTFTAGSIPLSEIDEVTLLAANHQEVQQRPDRWKKQHRPDRVIQNGYAEVERGERNIHGVSTATVGSPGDECPCRAVGKYGCALA